jgi:archaellum biogenesis protein FlaJ (TadC family)
VIANNAKAAAQRGLFLVPPDDTDDRHERFVARARGRVRRWEARRRRASQALIALSFPMVYMLVMQTAGAMPSIAAIRFVIAVWTAALAVAGICAEAAWRNRARLEHMTGGPSV